MSWFWLNIPLCAAFFAAVVGIPLWMVLRHPNWGPEPADTDRRITAGQKSVQAVRPVHVPDTAEARELVGASAGA
jgi:hypothetical protein